MKMKKENKERLKEKERKCLGKEELQQSNLYTWDKKNKFMIKIYQQFMGYVKNKTYHY